MTRLLVCSLFLFLKNSPNKSLVNLWCRYFKLCYEFYVSNFLQLFTAPLFDAFQENLQEKDSLIRDYEKQFENINKKSKEIVTENKALVEKVNALEQELVQVKQSYKKLIVEKETSDIEKTTILERAERAESKLKEVYELYEGKSKLYYNLKWSVSEWWGIP